MTDPINPNYYKGILVIPKSRLSEFLDEEGNLSLEYMDLMQFILTPEELRGHLKGQAWKYLLRLGEKDEGTQEIGKSIWYLNYLKNIWKLVIKGKK